MTPEEQRAAQEALDKELKRRQTRKLIDAEIERRAKKREFEDYSAWRRGDPSKRPDVLARRIEDLEKNAYGKGALQPRDDGVYTRDGEKVWPTKKHDFEYEDRLLAQIGEEASKSKSALPYDIRRQRSIKFSPAAKKELVEARTRAVFDTPKGQVFIDKEDVARPVDKANPKGYLASTLLGLAGLPVVGSVVAEAVDPGFHKELGGDIIDFFGEAEESAPEIGADLIARKLKAGGIARTGGQVLGAGTGTFLRRLHSQSLPGRDISIPETLTAATANMALSGAAEGLTSAATGAVRAADGYFGRQLLGEASKEALEDAVGLAKKFGDNPTPGQLSADPSALSWEGFLRQAPGEEGAWLRRDLQQLEQANKTVQRVLDTSVRTNPVSGGKMLANAIFAESKAAKRGAVNAFKKNLRAANTAFGGAPVVAQDTMNALVEKMAGEGLDMRRIKALIKRHSSVVEAAGPARPRQPDWLEPTAHAGTPGAAKRAERRMTAEQVVNLLHEFTLMKGNKRPALPLTKGRDDWVGEEFERAMLDDLAIAGKDEALGPGRMAIIEGRKNYALAHEVMNAESTKLVKQIMNMEADEMLSTLPKQILANRFSDEQVTRLVLHMEQNNPVAAQHLRAAAYEQVLEKAIPDPTTALGIAVKRSGKQTPQASKLVKAVSEHKQRLRALNPDNPKFAQELEDIIDHFAPKALAEKYGFGSQTANIQQKIELLRSVPGLLFSPVQSTKNIGFHLWRKRLSRKIADPVQKDILIGLAKDLDNIPLHIVKRQVLRLQGLAARDKWIFREESKEDE